MEASLAKTRRIVCQDGGGRNSVCRAPIDVMYVLGTAKYNGFLSIQSPLEHYVRTYIHTVDRSTACQGTGLLET